MKDILVIDTNEIDKQSITLSNRIYLVVKIAENFSEYGRILLPEVVLEEMVTHLVEPTNSLNPPKATSKLIDLKKSPNEFDFKKLRTELISGNYESSKTQLVQNSFQKLNNKELPFDTRIKSLMRLHLFELLAQPIIITLEEIDIDCLERIKNKCLNFEKPFSGFSDEFPDKKMEVERREAAWNQYCNFLPLDLEKIMNEKADSKGNPLDGLKDALIAESLRNFVKRNSEHTDATFIFLTNNKKDFPDLHNDQIKISSLKEYSEKLLDHFSKTDSFYNLFYLSELNDTSSDLNRKLLSILHIQYPNKFDSTSELIECLLEEWFPNDLLYVDPSDMEDVYTESELEDKKWSVENTKVNCFAKVSVQCDLNLTLYDNHNQDYPEDDEMTILDKNNDSWNANLDCNGDHVIIENVRLNAELRINLILDIKSKGWEIEVNKISSFSFEQV